VMTDSAQVWTTDMWAGCSVRLTGTPAGGGSTTINQNILANSSTTLTLTGPSAANLSGVTYEIDLPTRLGIAIASSSDRGAHFMFRGFLDKDDGADFPAITTGPG